MISTLSSSEPIREYVAVCMPLLRADMGAHTTLHTTSLRQCGLAFARIGFLHYR